MIPTLYKTFQKWSNKGSIYIVSDTHFEDSDCEFMDENWPAPEDYVKSCFAKLTKNDTLIHLGDVGNPEYMKTVPSYKVLLLGNHDVSASKFEPYFDEIYTGPLMIAEKILLSHEPIDVTWALNIHGHDHNQIHQEDDCHVNCAANIVGYKLLNLKDIIREGKLSNIVSLHRQTIETATVRKSKLNDVSPAQIMIDNISWYNQHRGHDKKSTETK